MSAYQHRIGYNWITSFSFKPGEESLSEVLRGLDGVKVWCISLWQMSEDLSRIRASDAHEYLQAAGSSVAMTLAITTAEPRSGDTHSQYTVGRRVQIKKKLWQRSTKLKKVRLKWNGGGTTVFENEVFTADEAIPIFAFYLKHNTVPSDLELRLIDTISY